MDGRIKLTPDQLRNISDVFRERSNSVKDMLEHLNSQVENIESLWDGAAQGSYFIQFSELQEPLNKFPQTLDGIACTLDNVAGTFEDADRLLASNMGDTGIASSTGRLYNDELTNITPMRSLAGIPAPCAMGGDPINLSTGNFVYYKEDIEIPGSFPLAFKRFYNAIGNLSSVLGSGWTHSYNIHLSKKKNSVEISFDDGHVEVYNRLDDGGFFAPMEHSKNEFQEHEDGYLLTLPTRDMYVFNNDGQLQGIYDANENCTNFSYADDLLMRVSNSCGSLSFEYNEAQHLVKVLDHTGRKVEFIYRDNRLVEAVHPSGEVFGYTYNAQGYLSELTNPLNIKTIRNEYDEGGRTVNQHFVDGGVYALKYDDDKRTTSITEQNGNEVKYYRDKYYRTVRIDYGHSDNERFGYDAHNNRTLYTNRNGHAYKYCYDEQDNLIKSIDPMGGKTSITYDNFNLPVEITKANGGITSMSYDSVGNLVKLSDQLQREVQFTNNYLGLTTEFVLPDASKKNIEYDERGNVVAIVDSNGSSNRYVYDELNRVVKAINGEGQPTFFEYTESGDIARVIDAAGNTCQYDYNRMRKITRVTDFDGSTIEYKYNSVGKVEEIIDQAGGSTKYTFDLMWNVTSVTNPTGNTVRYVYDKNQRIIQTIDEEGYITHYEHDRSGNVTATISPNGARTEIKHDPCDRPYEIIEPNGAKTELQYDKVGNLTDITDALGNTTKREYDLASQLIGFIDPLGNKTQFMYTPLGKLECVINAKGEKQTYTYYPGGNLKSVTLPSGASESYQYNKDGNVTKITDALGNEKTLVYDAMQRITETINPLGHSKKFAYDALGRITQVTDENGFSTHYKYSLLGDVIEVIDAAGHSTKYDYDGARRLTKLEQCRLIDDTLADVTCPEYQLTIYQRNKKGEIISVTSPLDEVVKFGYDEMGNVTSKVDEDGLETLYAYNLVGKLTKVSYADGKTVEYGYDALNQLTQMKDWLGTTNIELDPLGRTTRVTDFEDNEIGYTWDSIGQRQKLVYPNGSEVRYEYNASGMINKVLTESGITKFFFVTDIIGLIRKALNFKGFANWSYFYCSRGAKLSEGGQVDLGLSQ